MMHMMHLWTNYIFCNLFTGIAVKESCSMHSLNLGCKLSSGDTFTTWILILPSINGLLWQMLPWQTMPSPTNTHVICWSWLLSGHDNQVKCWHIVYNLQCRCWKYLYITHRYSIKLIYKLCELKSTCTFQIVRHTFISSHTPYSAGCCDELQSTCTRQFDQCYQLVSSDQRL